MQQNWIGRSEGLLIRWKLAAETAPEGESELEVYTTRPDTIFGASFMAIAADHPLARKAAARNSELAAFCEECRRMGTSVATLETAEKKGFDTGIRVVHPFDESWTLPVYVANFVLMDYGTGAIFGCPSGDQRDLDFANKYGLPVVPVVMPEGEDAATFQIIDEAYVDDGVMINSRFLDGMTPDGLRRGRATAGKGSVGQPADGGAQGAVPAARLADLAPALLGLPDPGDSLRRLRVAAGLRRASADRTADRCQFRQAR
jgi:leucyl-tRNA synthetase